MSLSEAARRPPIRNRAPTAPNDRRRLHGSIAHDLAVAIIGGRYRPGDVLPNEDVFSQRLSVSRTAYREAVRILAAKGLVESRPKTGTRICERARWAVMDPDVLAWHLEADPSIAFITQLFELRRIIEPPAAALAALRRGEEDLQTMRAALDEMGRDKISTARGMQADLDFHHAILVAARNDALTALSSGIGTTIRWSTAFKIRAGVMPRDPIGEHWRVYEAIRAGQEAEAGEAMRVLVDDALEATRRALGENTLV